jgi:uncharacterized protein YndB with AHSA1/START domain
MSQPADVASVETAETPTAASAASRRRFPLWGKILIALSVLVVAFLGVVAMQPSDFRVTRSAVLAAPPEVVFAQVNDFHNWEAWSPWADLDPQAKETFEGPDRGEGAVLHWDGNSEVGAGNMTITESRPHELILIRLEFIRPFAGVSTTEFAFQPEGEGTKVAWTMSGKNDFIGKAISLFLDCEKLVGEQFEEGLENMRAIVETTPERGLDMLEE